MIPGLRSRLIDDIRRRLAQPSPLTLEPNIRDPRDILLPVSKVILKEQRQPLHLPEEGALDGDLLDVGSLGELEGLCGLGVFCGGKVEVGLVDV